MKRKWWLWGIIIVLLGAGGYAGYRIYRSTTGAAAAEAATGVVETVTVARGSLRVTVEGSGSVAPADEAQVSFKRSGRIDEVLVEIGSEVKAGDVLARLDSTDAAQTVEEARLQVKQAEHNLALAQLEADAGVAQANLDAAVADHERAVTNSGAVGDQLTSTRIKYKQAQEALADAQEAYTTAYDPGREWELGDQRLRSRLEAERESAERNLQNAKDNLEIARAAYNLAIIGADTGAVQAAEIKIANAQLALDKQAVQLEQLQVSLDQAQLKLASAQRTLDELTLEAPIDGVVTALTIQEGGMANAGQAALTLSTLDQLIVEVGLEESDIASIQAGQSAVILLDAFRDSEFAGTITDIAPTAKVQSGVVLYQVTVAMEPAAEPVRAGMTADVEVVTGGVEDALVLPLKALQSVGGRTFVLRYLREGEEAPATGALPAGTGAVSETRQPGSGAGLGAAFSGMTEEERLAAREQMSSLRDSATLAGYVLTPVELGFITDTQAEIVSGLEEGDIIALPGSLSEASNTASGTGSSQIGMPGAGLFLNRP